MAQCLDKLTPDAFVCGQCIQTQFWSGSQLMTCLLLLESPAGEPHRDASRYPSSIPGTGHRAGCSLGLSMCALVLSKLRRRRRRMPWLCGVCVIPAAWLRCGAPSPSTHPEDNTLLLSAWPSWAQFDRGELKFLLPVELLSVHHLGTLKSQFMPGADTAPRYLGFQLFALSQHSFYQWPGECECCQNSLDCSAPAVHSWKQGCEWTAQNWLCQATFLGLLPIWKESLVTGWCDG